MNVKMICNFYARPPLGDGGVLSTVQQESYPSEIRPGWVSGRFLWTENGHRCSIYEHHGSRQNWLITVPGDQFPGIRKNPSPLTISWLLITDCLPLSVDLWPLLTITLWSYQLTKEEKGLDGRVWLSFIRSESWEGNSPFRVSFSAVKVPALTILDWAASRYRMLCKRIETPSEDVLVRTNVYPFGRALEPCERYNKTAALVITPFDLAVYAYRPIQFNWRKAQIALERAREVYVIGYSMPKEDMAFRLLAKIVSHRWNSDVTVDVWNPDPLVGETAAQIFGKQRVTFHQACASSFCFR